MVLNSMIVRKSSAEIEFDTTKIDDAMIMINEILKTNHTKLMEIFKVKIIRILEKHIKGAIRFQNRNNLVNDLQ